MEAAASQESVADTQTPQWALPSLIAANALLALGPMFVRMADVGPVASAFWRMAIALPLIAGAAAASGVRTRAFTPRIVLVVALSGLLFSADLASWHLGIVRTKVANATLFGNSASLIYPLYGFLVARAWPSRRQGLALLLAAAGAMLLMGRSAELGPEHLLGDMLSLLAGVFYAFYFIAIAHARATFPPLPLLALSTAATALPLLLLALTLGERIAPVNWWPLIGLALCSQVIGQGLLTRALGRISPLVIGLALLMQPVVAALTGWLVYGETLAPVDLAGAALIAAALVLVR